MSQNNEYYIIDAGSKVLRSDLDAHGAGRSMGFGIALTLNRFDCGDEGMTVTKLSEEHGFLKREEGNKLSLGQKVRLLPNHACAVVNLSKHLIVLHHDGRLENYNVAAAGCVR